MTGEPAETPTPEPVKEEPVQQPPRDDPARDDPAPEDTTPPAGTIDTITATDAAGQLLLTWTTPPAPNADPTDYHVNWAKSTEEYPANTAEAGNAHPTGTTHTLAGLEFDTDYKIHVRARYTDGENAASPWNGPWTETTAQVKLPLPAAPFIGAIAVSPDREVLLTWFNSEENNSITGYQVLRGPDADSLAVIEDDTGSTSTSYTDETPPAGQTHTYAVKARNATGLSPLSNTLTATVPAAEEEEELTTARHESGENTLVSNLDQAAAILTFPAASGIPSAQQFTTGNNPKGYHATEVDLYLRLDTTDIPDPVVTIQGDNSGIPDGIALFTFTTASAVTNASYQLFTFTTGDRNRLLPNTRYWLHVATSTAVQMEIQSTESDTEDPDSQSSWEIRDGGHFKEGGNWLEFPNNNLRLEIRGHESDGPTLVSNLGQTDEGTVFLSNELSGAQSFVAGPGLAGFGYRFQGVRVSARPTRFDVNIFVPEVKSVSLHSDASGLPGTRLHTLTVPDDFASTAGFSDYTLSAPPGTVLSGGARYWVVFEVQRLNLVLSTTNSTDEDQTPPPVAGWLIDDRRYAYDILDNPVWAIAAQVIKLAVLGSPEWVTDEPAGEDFPGADFNAHETTGVVTVGTASSGDMTAGLDRNHGQTGDYWYLDTKPGHSYRVEVTFGASTRISTGGSAGIEFLDPDGVDYASSCCESDHNREDSATFVHFTHSRQSREWNRSYMVYVAAFDLYNEGTAVYNGPYLITLTDITGVQQMVHSFRGGTDYPATDLLESTGRGHGRHCRVIPHRPPTQTATRSTASRSCSTIFPQGTRIR